LLGLFVKRVEIIPTEIAMDNFDKIFDECWIMGFPSSCNELCLQYKPKYCITSKGRYKDGQKRCQICQVYIIWNGVRCPCCNFTLRTKPRNGKLKNKL